jgi:hypothetical protein
VNVIWGGELKTEEYDREWRFARNAAVGRRPILLALLGGGLASCQSRSKVLGPSIEFTRVPQADAGGREKNDIIEGTVKFGRQDQSIVLYAKTGNWWVQPMANEPFTKVNPTTKWTNATHLGTDYAALLVEPGFRPPPFIEQLPTAGPGIVAVASTPGSKEPPSKIIPFSGNDWRVRDAPSSRGGNNQYDPSNAWTDSSGALHLRIAKKGKDWTCAEVTLTRSLGYGTYRFVVRDTSQLEPAAVFGMFTWDYAGGAQGNREMDIEIGRWGNPAIQNAQYVVQPYYVASNLARFSVPSGPLTHSFLWEPGRVTFRTVKNSQSGAGSSSVSEHVFKSGVPSPGIESVRMNLYYFRQAVVPLRDGAEVVVERFEYLP